MLKKLEAFQIIQFNGNFYSKLIKLEKNIWSSRILQISLIRGHRVLVSTITKCLKNKYKKKKFFIFYRRKNIVFKVYKKNYQFTLCRQQKLSINLFYSKQLLIHKVKENGKHFSYFNFNKKFYGHKPINIFCSLKSRL